MRRVFVLAVIAGILSCESHAFAQSFTIPQNLANAIVGATMQSSGGTAVTGTASDPDASGDVTVTLSAESSSVVSMDFSTATLTGITSSDFASFDHYFSGLQSLKIALPDSYSGTFNLSLSSLTELDISGSTADFNLSVYGFPKLETLKASNCSNLKAVNFAEVIPDISYTVSQLSALRDLVVDSGLNSEILSSLKYVDLSNCPNLDRVGYLLSSIPGTREVLDIINAKIRSIDVSMYESTDRQVGGYKTHCVVTTLASGTEFTREETSYPVAPSGLSIFTTLYMDATWSYSGDDVNLLPDLEHLNMNGSGINASDYITSADISSLTTLISADLAGMTSLKSLTLPSGSTLTSLDLTGDTALAALNLSDVEGFTFPTGFAELSGMTSFTLTGRSDLTSIDVSGFTNLLELDLPSNALISLDLSANTKLKKLYVPNNSLRELDVSNCPNIADIDLRNNSLTKLDLSSNTGLSLDLASLATNTIKISGQLRSISGDRKRYFDFHDAGLTAQDFAYIIASSIKGDGVSAATFSSSNSGEFSASAFDVNSGIVTFDSYPSLITYDYDTGLYYNTGINNDDSNAVRMHVRLQIASAGGEVPLLWPTTASISATEGDYEITPVVITATSDSAVTWTADPATLPGGLTMTSDGYTFTIAGSPSAAYTGTVKITATNENGVSEAATVRVRIAEVMTETEVVPVPYPVPEQDTQDVSGDDGTASDDRPGGSDGTAPGGRDNVLQAVIMSPVSAELIVSVDSEIEPIIINAESSTTVTWSLYPEELPKGIEMNVNGKTLVLTGTPEEAYSGTILFIARDESGNSGYTVVKVEIAAEEQEPEIEPEPVSEDVSEVLPPDSDEHKEDEVSDMGDSGGGGGGCDSGLGVMALALLALKRRAH